jgi:hypothetical protein
MINRGIPQAWGKSVRVAILNSRWLAEDRRSEKKVLPRGGLQPALHAESQYGGWTGCHSGAHRPGRRPVDVDVCLVIPRLVLRPEPPRRLACIPRPDACVKGDRSARRDIPSELAAVEIREFSACGTHALKNFDRAQSARCSPRGSQWDCDGAHVELRINGRSMRTVGAESIPQKSNVKTAMSSRIA